MSDEASLQGAGFDETLLEELAHCLLNMPWEDRVVVESWLLLYGMGEVVDDLRRRIDRLADRAGCRERAE